ncbi:MAG: hypothetical protein APF76_15860 [Desulfitibacter sp. BRH_c19]|nr:MAG: hypothetical protein APF76_15860 [Desulfitibacter sp. BRH_c19]
MPITNDLEVIKQAIVNELEGYNFYMLAAEKESNPESKEAYIHFAKEEEKHLTWLKKLYKSVSEDTVILNPSEMEEVPSPHIFNWNTAGTESGSLAVSVFGIAIQMERSASDFYKKAAADTQIDAAKNLYLTLAKWEEDHLASFEKHYDDLKEEWWQQQGFSPS